MPRKARQQSSLCTYHVILRGVNQQIIFEDRYDYLQFIDMNDKNHNDGNKNNKIDSKEITKLVTNRDYSLRVSFDNNFLRQKYLLLTAKEYGVCSYGKQDW